MYATIIFTCCSVESILGHWLQSLALTLNHLMPEHWCLISKTYQMYINYTLWWRLFDEKRNHETTICLIFDWNWYAWCFSLRKMIYEKYISPSSGGANHEICFWWNPFCKKMPRTIKQINRSIRRRQSQMMYFSYKFQNPPPPPYIFLSNL